MTLRMPHPRPQLPYPSRACQPLVKAQGTPLRPHPQLRLRTSSSKPTTSCWESWRRGADTGSVCFRATPATSPPSPALLQERPVCLPRRPPPQPGPGPRHSPLPCLSPLLLPQPLAVRTTQRASSTTHYQPCRWGCRVSTYRNSSVLSCLLFTV